MSSGWHRSAGARPPPPPFDACLDGGAFNIADPECQLWHAPSFGDQFGPIGSVITHVVKRGDTLDIGFNPGDSIFYDRPISCGDAGCIHHAIFWRPQDDVIRDTWFERLEGCGGADESCRFRVWPNRDVGDESERWLVLYAQHYRGIFPQQGVAHAIYVAPRFYPVRVDSVDAAGDALTPRPGAPAYAVRAGRSVAASACLSGQWWTRYRLVLDPPVPDCVVLDQGADPLTGAPGWSGDLPVDSGDWSIVAAPAGDPGVPLLGRPTPYAPASVRPVGDDLFVQAVEQPRPRLTVTLEPELAEMALGSAQTVGVTVAAEGGETGELTLAFATPGGVSVDGSDPPVLVVRDADDASARFTMTPDSERTFLVPLSAVGVGVGGIETVVTGTDDLDRPVTADAAARIGVVEGDGEPASGADAPPAPVVDRAAAAPPGPADRGRLEGTASGQPGGTLTVTIWTSPADAGACSPRIAGTGVTLVGSTELTLGEDGSAPFALEAPLTAGWFAYGVAAVGSQVSRVGECALVAADVPTISIADASAVEGTAAEGTTPMELTVSLSQPAAEPVTVRVSTRDGDASSPADFAALAGVEVRFAPGETGASVMVDIVPDPAQEEDETFSVVLSDPAGGRLPGPGSALQAVATATIVDDDAVAIDNDTPDVRGVWRWVFRTRHQGQTLTATYTITITDQDPVTGAIKGRIRGQLYDPYSDYTGRVTGTVVGDVVRWRVTGAGRWNGPIAGTLVRRDGRLAIRLDVDGRVRYVLVDPRGE